MTAAISRRSPLGVVLALLLATLAVRAGLIGRTGFDGLYGQDAFAYFDYATAFRSALAQGQWPPSFFWPIGYPALSALFSLVLPPILAAQAVSLIATGSVVVFTFLITRDLLIDRPDALAASIAAALLVAVAGQLLVSSLSSMSDAASLAWATLSAFALVRFHRMRARRWLAAAGLALGWAIMTRWVYALLVPVWVAALFSEVDWRLLVAPRDLPKASETHPGKRSAPGLLGRFGAHADGAFSAAACTLVVLGFVLVGLSPQIALIARDASQGEVGYLGDAQTYWWNPANAWQSNITNADGQFHYERPIALYYSLPFVHPDYVAIWFTPFLLIGLWAMRRQPFPLVLLLGWVGVNWFFLAGVAWENWRFPIVFFPPLAVFTGGGVASLLERFRTRRGLILSAWIGAGLAIALAWGVRDASDFIAHQMQDRAIVQWASAQLPGDATVLCFGMTATMVHFTPFQVIEIADETPDSVTNIARDTRAVYLLIDQDNIESQWTGLAPQLNVRALRNQFALRLLGTRDDYVLYSIGRAR